MRPFPESLLHFLIGSEFASIRLRQALDCFRNLPIVQLDIFTDCFGRYEGPASIDGLRQHVELLLELGVET